MRRPSMWTVIRAELVIGMVIVLIVAVLTIMSVT